MKTDHSSYFVTILNRTGKKKRKNKRKKRKRKNKEKEKILA